MTAPPLRKRRGPPPVSGTDANPSIMISLAVPADLHAAAKLIAGRRGWSRSRVVREALVEYVNRHSDIGW